MDLELGLKRGILFKHGLLLRIIIYIDFNKNVKIKYLHKL